MQVGGRSSRRRNPFRPSTPAVFSGLPTVTLLFTSANSQIWVSLAAKSEFCSFAIGLCQNWFVLSNLTTFELVEAENVLFGLSITAVRSNGQSAIVNAPADHAATEIAPVR